MSKTARENSPYSKRQWVQFPDNFLNRDRSQPVEDIELVTRTNRNWILNFLPIVHIDWRQGLAKAAFPSTYYIQQTGSTGKADHTWFENAIEGLDQPGEWITDSKAGKIYYWPADGKQPDESVTLPLLTELIRVEGHNAEFRFTYSEDGKFRFLEEQLSQDKPVRNVHFEHLTFRGGDRDYWNDFDRSKPYQHSDAYSRTFQHDGDQYDWANALLRFRGAHGCTVRHCIFENTASSAFRADHYAQQCVIEDSTFRHLGGNGILFAGYGPGELDVNHHNIIRRNHIHHVCELVWHYNAIFLWQSGYNEVSHNYIHHCSYDGIYLGGVRSIHYGGSHAWSISQGKNVQVRKKRVWSGNPRINERLALLSRKQRLAIAGFDTMVPYLHTRHNQVRHNEIHDTMMKLKDGNSVYIACTGVDNVVSHNLIHSTRGERNCDIRFDATQYRTIIEKNVVIGRGVKYKQYNTVRQNYFFGGALFCTSKTQRGGEITKNLYYQLPALAPIYTVRGEDRFLAKAGPDGNLYWGRDRASVGKALQKAHKIGVDQKSTLADPRFKDLAKGDLSLLPDSPLKRFGTGDIDLDTIGHPGFPPKERFVKALQAASE